MNSSIYVYGTFEDGYTQYPADYAERLLQHGATLTEAPTAMVIHREGALMYYSYIRRMEGVDRKQYLGFCTVLNGVYVPQVKAMMQMYERIVSNLVTAGHLVRLDDAAHVVPAVKSLKAQQQLVERVQAYIARSLSQWEKDQQLLPPASYAVSDTHVERFDTNASEHDIADKACMGGYVVVTKEKGFDDDQLNSCKAIVARLSRERDELQQKNNELVTSVRRTIRREHRMRRWLLAAIAIAAVAWGFNKLLKHLEYTQENLDTAVSTITGQRDRISMLNNSMGQLQQEMRAEQKARIKAEQQLAQWREQVGAYVPMLVYDVEVANVTEHNHIITDYGEPIRASQAQYLKPRLEYTGLREADEVHINVRLYTPNGQVMTGYTSPEGFTYQQTVMVSEGDNELALMGWGAGHGSFRPGIYRFEFWHGHICLKALSFRLY